MNNTIRHDKDGGFTVIPEKQPITKTNNMKIKTKILIETRSPEVFKYAMENYKEHIVSYSQDHIYGFTIETGSIRTIPDEIAELKKAIDVIVDHLTDNK